MSEIELNGVHIAYEIIGDGKKTAVITPGGRFSKDTPGVRELATKLAEAGYKALIWDRLNTGASDVCFTGENESAMNADALAGLLKALKMSPAYIIGGSAGARVSLLTAIRHPDVAERLAVLWITGGLLGLAMLAYHYCHNSMYAAAVGGMEAVTQLPEWKESLERNPRNRDIMLRQDAQAFVQKMMDWGAAYIPAPGVSVPGVTPDALKKLKLPVMVFRSGQSDVHHPRITSETVAAGIPGAKLVEPPWGDREWLDRGVAQARGEGIFARWPLLAPQLLEFAKS
jgi:pimeloyl-ACP methyl ester carboxylesterase